MASEHHNQSQHKKSGLRLMLLLLLLWLLPWIVVVFLTCWDQAQSPEPRPYQPSSASALQYR